jgi:hypothetical protein
MLELRPQRHLQSKESQLSNSHQSTELPIRGTRPRRINTTSSRELLKAFELGDSKPSTGIWGGCTNGCKATTSRANIRHEALGSHQPHSAREPMRSSGSAFPPMVPMRL